MSLHNTARDNKFGGWRNRYRYSLGVNNRQGDRIESWSVSCAESIYASREKENLKNFQEIGEIEGE